MARKKMRSAFHRNSRNNQSSSEGGSSLTITSLDQLNTYRPQVAPEVIQARNCPTRQCALFTFLTIDPTGNWRIIATPLQCPDHASHPNIYDEPENIPGISYSRARMRRQLRNRLLSSITSGPDPISTTSDSTPAHSYTNESLEMLLLELGDDKSAKTNKSKKARRKERQRQKLLSNGGGSAEAETASETSVLVSPESEIEGKDNAVWTAGSSPESPNSRCCSDPSELDSSSMSSNGDEIIQIDVRISDYRKGKKVNQVTVLNSSSRHANTGNNWWTKETIGKENNHSVWQQVRKQVKDENVSSADEAKEDKEKSPSKGTEESKKEHSLGPKKGGSAADVDLKERSDFGDVPEENSVSMSPRVRSEAEPVQELHVCTNESLQDQLDGGNPEDDVKQKSTQKGFPIGNIANLEEELEANSIVEIALPSSVGHNAEMSVDTMDKSVQAQTKPLQTPNSGSKLKIGKEVVPFFPSKVQRHPFEALFSSDKIMQAVHNACLMQLESESVHTMTGSPVAEFENLLYACCPEIAQSSDGGLSLDLTLKRLWQWYEQPGCFGVEVKSLDYTNTSTLINNFQFRAYFVPYLSAVQLFRNRKQQPFMMPQSWNPTKEIADDVELLFEFFESAPPPQRRPFYEKIQELIRRGGPGAYGDHTKLGSVNFQDLDPRSWYSVAWYPIYRIPDGNFRAAFLTYHSLSNLVHRPCSQYISNGVVDSCIVSPPVGLHSYNAQGECWFQMSPCLWNHASGFHFPGFDPSRILMDRLRTLEEVACVMSRAVVNKGKGKCENRHHDYEFFVARNGY